MNEISDEKLFDLYKSGNEEAFKVLYERYKPKLYVFMRNMLNGAQPEDIGDYMQEVFVKVIKNANKYKKRYAFSTWIYKIARNHVYDIYRKDKKVVTDNEKIDNAQVKAETETGNGTSDLLYYLNKLPLEQREVILLRAEGFSFKEISQMLFIPKNTAITRNSRGIKKLKEYLNEDK